MLGNIVVILIIAVICFFAIRHYAHSVTHGGCCGGGDDEVKVTVSDKNPAHYPHTLCMQVTGMTCAHCKQRVENALNSLSGVWAEVDLNSGKATVHMKEALTEDELRRVVVREGYHVDGFETIA